MSEKSTRVEKLLMIGVFVLGLGATGFGYDLKYARVQTETAFTMTSEQTFTGTDGKSWLNAIKVRFQKADGAWKEVTTYYKPDGSVLAVNKRYSIYGRGVFEVNEQQKKLLFVGPRLHEVHVFSEAEARKDSDFVREDSVLGYKTLVTRVPDSEGSSDYTEFHRAPDLNGVYLKTVFASSEGYSTVIEATKIELGEPAASEFADLPNYPVGYDFYETKIQIMESRGNHDLAEQMRQLLQAQKQGHQ